MRKGKFAIVESHVHIKENPKTSEDVMGGLLLSPPKCWLSFTCRLCLDKRFRCKEWSLLCNETCCVEVC